MTKNMVASALFAGLVSGLLVALLQTLLLEPLLLEAELYESGQLVHFGNSAGAAPDVAVVWDWARVAMSFVASIAVYVAFSLLMVAVYVYANMHGVTISARQGILWGLAGFASVSLLPSLGLAPDLPGMSTGALRARQFWWVGTIIMSAAGIAMLVFGKNWKVWGGAVILIALPHIIGAPQPDQFLGAVPPELAAEFTGRSLGVNAIGWALVGMLTAYFWTRSKPE